MEEKEKLTQQIEALKDALAAGATHVSFGDKSISFRSLTEMIQLINLLEGKRNRKKVTFTARFNKGLMR